MNAKTILTLTCLVLISAPTLADPPEVTNIRASQRFGTKLIDVYYDLADTDGDPCTIAITIYSGSTPLPVFSISGDVGPGITPGADKHIIWNAGQDWNRRYTTQGKARIVADDASTTPPSSSMVFVPAGFSNPGVEIYTSGFFMDKFEVSKALWDSVHSWALSNGYSFSATGVATDATHPITGISWYDAVKWCNARSEMEGLNPCYYTDAGQTVVYKTGEPILDNNWVAWTSNGYRLPTRAEWLKAYWGGNYSGYFPWPSYGGSDDDHINGGLANFFRSDDPFEVDSDYATTPVGYYDGSQIPQGPDMANGFGLYDMAGNVGEWNWDRHLTNWYSLSEAQDDNSKGPNTGLSGYRYFSGVYGPDYNFSGDARDQRDALASNRYFYPSATYGGTAVGFRCVRSR